MNENLTTVCPDEEMLAELLCGKCSAEVVDRLAQHVAKCPRCLDLCRFAIAAEADVNAGAVAALERGEAEALRQILRQRMAPQAGASAWDALRSKLAQLVATYEAGEVEVIAAAEDRGTLYFKSQDARHFWSAAMRIPAEVTEPFEIVVKDAKGEVYEAGTFVFCGNELEVVSGKALMPVANLRASLANSQIAYRFSDGTVAAGVPLLAMS